MQGELHRLEVTQDLRWSDGSRQTKSGDRRQLHAYPRNVPFEPFWGCERCLYVMFFGVMFLVLLRVFLFSYTLVRAH